MPRALLVFLLLLSVRVYSQEPSCKTFLECQARVHSWEQWFNENVPKCKTAMADAKRLDDENSKLHYANEDLQSENYRLKHSEIGFELLISVVGIGLGIGSTFYLARALRRFWRISARGKQLAFMVLGAFWMTGAALVAVNDSDLSKHPVNMLFTVLVYSLPGLLFGGIGFWWFGRAVGNGAAHG